ncbi:hypothetical protein KY348_04860 [Candidatus Woesearchaeota archaeon]|nr:hypothetical protein [Candidatus Woesearchaeota archaeon]
MSLRNNNTLLITLCVLIFLIMSISLLFPSIPESIITGIPVIDSFNVTVSIMHAVFDTSNRTQLDNVLVNGSNITMNMHVIYYDNITMNLTLDKPTGFECGLDWYINESGSIKNVTVNGTELTWEADKSIKDTFIYFEVSAPLITSDVIYTGDSYYERTMVFESCCPLINASANISVSTDYQDYVLYLIENNTLINRSSEYHLQVSNARATFYDFNLSNNKTFRIQAAPNVSIVNIIIHSGGGGGGGGGGAMPLINYTPTQQFLVEPNYLSITTMVPGFLEHYLTIYNLRGTEKDFNISFTTNFVYHVTSKVTIPHKDSATIPIYINTSGLEPGEYTDHITVSDGKDEENITITLSLLEADDMRTGEEKLPDEEQPTPISDLEKEKLKKERGEKTNLFATLAIILGGLIIMGVVVFLHLKRGTKVIKF